MPEQNLEISVTPTPIPDVRHHALYAGARPKRKAITALSSQQQSGNEASPKICPYHVSLELPITYELPSSWTENETVPKYLERCDEAPSNY